MITRERERARERQREKRPAKKAGWILIETELNSQLNSHLPEDNERYAELGRHKE
jgi:hypothetical protein